MSRELNAVAHFLAGKMMIAEVVVGLAACLPAGLFFFFLFVSCLLFVCCLLFVVCCLLFVVCSLLLVACYLFAVCCL